MSDDAIAYPTYRAISSGALYEKTHKSLSHQSQADDSTLMNHARFLVRLLYHYQ